MGLLAALLTVAGFWSIMIIVSAVLPAAGIPKVLADSLLKPLWAISPIAATLRTYFSH